MDVVLIWITLFIFSNATITKKKKKKKICLLKQAINATAPSLLALIVLYGYIYIEFSWKRRKRENAKRVIMPCMTLVITKFLVNPQKVISP